MEIKSTRIFIWKKTDLSGVTLLYHQDYVSGRCEIFISDGKYHSVFMSTYWRSQQDFPEMRLVEENETNAMA